MQNDVTQEQLEKGLANYDAAVAWVREKIIAAANEVDERKYANEQQALLEQLSNEDLEKIVNGLGFFLSAVRTLMPVVDLEWFARNER